LLGKISEIAMIFHTNSRNNHVQIEIPRFFAYFSTQTVFK